MGNYSAFPRVLKISRLRWLVSGAQANHRAWPGGVLSPVIKRTGEHVGEEIHNPRSCVHTRWVILRRATDIHEYYLEYTAYSFSPEQMKPALGRGQRMIGTNVLYDSTPYISTNHIAGLAISKMVSIVPVGKVTLVRFTRLSLVGYKSGLEQDLNEKNSIIVQSIRYRLYYAFLLGKSATIHILVTVLDHDIQISLSGRQGPRTGLP